LLAFPKDGNGNFNCYSHNLTPGKSYILNFTQFKYGNDYFYALDLDGEKFQSCPHLMENATPRVYRSIQVYASDPWHYPASTVRINKVTVASSSSDEIEYSLPC